MTDRRWEAGLFVVNIYYNLALEYKEVQKDVVIAIHFYALLANYH